MTNLVRLLKSRDIANKGHLVKAMVFQWSCMDGLLRNLSAEEMMRLNCGVGEDS